MARDSGTICPHTLHDSPAEQAPKRGSKRPRIKTAKGAGLIKLAAEGI